MGARRPLGRLPQHRLTRTCVTSVAGGMKCSSWSAEAVRLQTTKSTLCWRNQSSPVSTSGREDRFLSASKPVRSECAVCSSNRGARWFHPRIPKLVSASTSPTSLHSAWLRSAEPSRHCKTQLQLHWMYPMKRTRTPILSAQSDSSF